MTRSPMIGHCYVSCGFSLDYSGMFGFEQISNVSDEHIAKLEKKYTEGKKVRARVIGHRAMDALAIVSLKVHSLTSHPAYVTLVFTLVMSLLSALMMLFNYLQVQWSVDGL